MRFHRETSQLQPAPHGTGQSLPPFCRAAWFLEAPTCESRLTPTGFPSQPDYCLMLIPPTSNGFRPLPFSAGKGSTRSCTLEPCSPLTRLATKLRIGYSCAHLRLVGALSARDFLPSSSRSAYSATQLESSGGMVAACAVHCLRFLLLLLDQEPSFCRR